MREKMEACQYAGRCVLRHEFGEEVCRLCTVSPMERRIQRRLKISMWMATGMNVAAFVFNLVRAIVR